MHPIITSNFMLSLLCTIFLHLILVLVACDHIWLCLTSHLNVSDLCCLWLCTNSIVNLILHDPVKCFFHHIGCNYLCPIILKLACLSNHIELRTSKNWPYDVASKNMVIWTLSPHHKLQSCSRPKVLRMLDEMERSIFYPLLEFTWKNMSYMLAWSTQNTCTEAKITHVCILCRINTGTYMVQLSYQDSCNTYEASLLISISHLCVWGR